MPNDIIMMVIDLKQKKVEFDTKNTIIENYKKDVVNNQVRNINSNNLDKNNM